MSNGSLKWAAITISVVVVLCGAVFTQSLGKADEGDVRAAVDRVTALEVALGRQDERLKRIEADVRWIRARIERGEVIP